MGKGTVGVEWSAWYRNEKQRDSSVIGPTIGRWRRWFELSRPALVRGAHHDGPRGGSIGAVGAQEQHARAARSHARDTPARIHVRERVIAQGRLLKRPQ